jgi:predicted nucleic acid-binding protein
VPDASTIVVADTSVLINIILVSRLELLGALDGFRFVVSEQVVEEVTREDQARQLMAAFDQGLIHRETSTEPGELALYSELRGSLGRGEAATLAMAGARGWWVACDERGRFLADLL